MSKAIGFPYIVLLIQDFIYIQFVPSMDNVGLN